MHRFFALFVVLLAVLGLPARAAEKPLVVSTNTIAHDLVQHVAGDLVVAQCLLPAGSDPHGYEPKPADIRHVARADLVVVNGLGFESWISKLVANSGFKGPVVTLAEGITPLTGGCTADHDHDHHHPGDLDPHAWQDVRNVIRYVENLRLALVTLLPGHAAALNKTEADTQGFKNACSRVTLQ